MTRNSSTVAEPDCDSLIERSDAEKILAGLAGSFDRTLPVPLGVQLRGLIEFGIALGELPSGVRLPSVRELAERAGIAPMTVATVYRELRQSGLIKSKPGAGTYVGDGHSSDGLRSAAMRKLQRRIDGLFNEAEELGLAPSLVASLVNARAARGRSSLRPLRLLMVGNFIDTTQQYVDSHPWSISAPGDTIVATTVGALEEPVRHAALRSVRDTGAPARRGREPVAGRHPGRRAEFHSRRGNPRAPRHDRPDGADRHRVDLSRIHGADEARRPVASRPTSPTPRCD